MGLIRSFPMPIGSGSGQGIDNPLTFTRGQAGTYSLEFVSGGAVMTQAKLIHALTIVSSALSAVLGFMHASGNIISDPLQHGIMTGLTATIAAIGAVLTVLRSSSLKGK